MFLTAALGDPLLALAGPQLLQLLGAEIGHDAIDIAGADHAEIGAGRDVPGRAFPGAGDAAFDRGGAVALAEALVEARSARRGRGRG